MLNQRRMESVLLSVVMERKRQDARDKTGMQRVVVASPATDPLDSLVVLMEEVGEVARALHEDDLGRVVDELVHVAAVAIAMGEGLLGKIATTDATDDTGIGALNPHD